MLMLYDKIIGTREAATPISKAMEVAKVLQ